MSTIYKRQNCNNFEDKVEQKPEIHPLDQLKSYLLFNLFGGPHVIQLRYLINSQKITTVFYCIFLMHYFQNYSLGACIYTSVHGSYGYCWLLKDFAFGDLQWKQKVTIPSVFLSLFFVFGTYWYLPYAMMSGQGFQNPSMSRIITTIIVYVWGIALMLSADAQKNSTLKIKKGLISDGLFAYTRNPNYLGEIMIYTAFGILQGSWLGWINLFSAWILVFGLNMYLKDLSLRRKLGWNEYERRSNLLLPRIFNSPVLDWSIYIIFSAILYNIYLKADF